MQRYGTAKVGALFGPIILAWFVALAVVGAVHVVEHPGVLAAFNPAVNNINNFVRTSIEDGATFIEVDQDGAAGGANFDDAAVLVGVTTDVLGLLNNGSLVLAD